MIANIFYIFVEFVEKNFVSSEFATKSNSPLTRRIENIVRQLYVVYTLGGMQKWIDIVPSRPVSLTIISRPAMTSILSSHPVPGRDGTGLVPGPAELW
jgi:hypothetical protein